MAEKFDINTVKTMDIKAILQLAKMMRGEISDFILDKNMNKLKDLTVISKKRKELARTLTILRQKQLLAAFEQANPGEVKEPEATAETKVKTKAVKTEKKETK